MHNVHKGIIHIINMRRSVIVEHTRNYLQTRDNLYPPPAVRRLLSNIDKKNLRTARNTLGTTARRSVVHWAKYFFICIHKQVVFIHLQKAGKFDELRNLLKKFATKRKAGVPNASDAVYKFLQDNCGDIELLQINDLRDFTYGLKNVNMYEHGVVSDKAYLTTLVESELEDTYVCKLHMVMFDDGTASVASINMSPDCKPTPTLGNQHLQGAPKKLKLQPLTTAASKPSVKSGSPGTKPIELFLQRKDANTLLPVSSSEEASNTTTSPVRHQLFDATTLIFEWTKELNGTVNPGLIFHYFDNTQLLTAPRKLPYRLMTALWDIVLQHHKHQDKDIFLNNNERDAMYDKFHQHAVQCLKFRYFVEIPHSYYDNVIPGNGYCFYLCMYYLYKKHKEEDVSTIFAEDVQWVDAVVNELQKEIEFWDAKVSSLKQSRNLVLTLHFDFAIKDLKYKLKGTLDKLIEDIANGVRPNLPVKYWAGTEIGSMVFAERLEFPVVGFRESSTEEMFIKQIAEKYRIMDKRFIELNSANSQSLRIAVENDLTNNGYGGAFPYRTTSVFRDQLFNGSALKQIFEARPLAFATVSGHNSPVDLNTEKTLQFFECATETIIQDIFAFVYPAFRLAMRKGVTKFATEHEYDQFHSRYFMHDDIVAPPQQSSQSKKSSPSDTQKTMSLIIIDADCPKTPQPPSQDHVENINSNNNQQQLQRTPTTSNSMYVLDKTIVQELVSSVYDSLSCSSFDSAEEMWSRFYKVLQQKVGFA